MKSIAALGMLAVPIALAAQAQGGGAAPALGTEARPERPDWSEWTRPLAPAPVLTAATEPRSPPADPAAAVAPAAEIDVVDAHWVALTMWGEARSGGEEAMRAVGHVIDNRRRSGLHGRYATETVSKAFQFSCWNRNDPNYQAMLNVDRLREGGEDHLMWLAAKRLAAEILAGSSADPTGGALFYHTAAVAPRWSAGLTPITQIGGHLFFRSAR